MEPDANPALQGEWGESLQAALAARWTNNHSTKIQRLSDAAGYLPGFGPSTQGEPAINRQRLI